MPDWLIWIVAAAGLAVGEILTAGFILGPIGLAALLGALVAGLGGGAVAQLVAFLLGSLGSLLIVRPIAKRHLRTPPPARTGTAALIGETAVVLERVDADGGRIKLAGEVWSARAFDHDEAFEPGQRVTVIEISGATALVAA